MEYKNDKTANRRRYKSRYHSPHNYKTQRSKSENRAAILVGVATFVVLASLVLVFTFGDSIFKFLDTAFTSGGNNQEPTAPVNTLGIATEPGSEEPTVKPVVIPTMSANTEATSATENKTPQSEDFNRLASAAGVDAATLTASQMIFVETSDSGAAVYTYEKGTDGKWNQKFEAVSAYIGEDGAAADSVPYDNVTPKGVFNIEYAMGTNPDPGASLNYHEIVKGDRWITDPASVNYNRMIDEKASLIDFETSQDLTEYTVSYPYAIVFSYNRSPVDASKGCAKFLHVSSKPTRGGVGISEDELYKILMWLKPESNPQIAIF